jgi:hypothetical protein
MVRIMQDKRRDGRAPQNKTGVIKFGAAGYELPCTVIDLTINGAGIAVASAFGIPKVFQLAIKGETSARHCKMIWAQGGKLGVSFE